jgi:hypothetical protein
MYLPPEAPSLRVIDWPEILLVSALARRVADALEPKRVARNSPSAFAAHNAWEFAYRQPTAIHRMMSNVAFSQRFSLYGRWKV